MLYPPWTICAITLIWGGVYGFEDFKECNPVGTEKYPMMEVWEVGVRTFEMYENEGRTESQIFSVWSNDVEEKWYLRLYPAGVKSSSPGHFGLYLISQNHHVTSPDIEILVINRDELYHIRKTIVDTFKQFGERFGWADFASSAVIIDPSEGFVLNGKIQIGVRFFTGSARLRPPQPSAVFHWPVPVEMMKLKTTIHMDSPLFQTWDEFGFESKWYLVLLPGGLEPPPHSSKSNSTFTLMYLVSVGQPPVRVKVEYFVKNIRPEDSILSQGYNYRFGAQYIGLAKIANTIQLTNPANGFVNDGHIIFAVRMPMINMRQSKLSKAVVTETWETGVASFEMGNVNSSEFAVESPKTYVWNGGRKEGWHLWLFGNGFLPENEGYVSIFLNYDANHPMTTLTEVLLVNKDPRKNLRKWLIIRFYHYDQRTGWHRFISKETLLDPENGYVDNEKVKIMFRPETDLALPPTVLPLTTKMWEIALDDLLSGITELESPKYLVKTPNGTDVWYFKAYPQGYDSPGYLSLYLVYGIHNTTSSPRGEILLINTKEENSIRQWSFGDYKMFGQSIGWPRFAKIRDIVDESNGFVVDSRIRIILKIPEELNGVYKQTCPICSHNLVCEPIELTTPEPCPTLPPITSPSVTPTRNPQTPTTSGAVISNFNPVLESTLTRDENKGLNSFKYKNVTITIGNITISADELESHGHFHEVLEKYLQKTAAGPINIVIPP